MFKDVHVLCYRDIEDTTSEFVVTVLIVHGYSGGIHFFVVVLLQTVLRIWDCLFYEGSKILFRVALTLIHHNEALIQQAQSLPDVCQNFKQITHGPFVEECHTFMQVGQKERSPVTACHWKCNFTGGEIDWDKYLFWFSFFNHIIPVFPAFPRKSSLNQEVSPAQPWVSCGRRVDLALLQKNHEPELPVVSNQYTFHWDQRSAVQLHLFFFTDY